MNNNVKKVLYNIKNFGLFFGLDFLIHKTILKKNEWKTRKKSIKILDKEFGYIFKNNSKYGANNNEFEKNIFVFWGQGFNNLPEIPKLCIKSIERFYSDYNIYYITLENYEEYVSIDPNIKILFEKGNISIQTFSDILRFQLIYQYGGVWCDATLMFYEKIDFDVMLKEKSFYSLNVDCKEKRQLWGNVYPVTYTTFFFAARKKSYILKSINEAYIEYYKKYDFVIDYFLNDYFFILASMYEVEDNSLAKIPFVEGDVFYVLNSLLSNNTVLDINKCRQIPQKITWKNVTMENIKYDG